MSELSMRNTMESFLSRAAWFIQKDRMNIEDAVELFFLAFKRTPESMSALSDIASNFGVYQDRMNIEDAVELFFLAFKRTPESMSALSDIASNFGVDLVEAFDVEIVSALLGILVWRWNAHCQAVHGQGQWQVGRAKRSQGLPGNQSMIRKGVRHE